MRNIMSKSEEDEVFLYAGYKVKLFMDYYPLNI